MAGLRMWVLGAPFSGIEICPPGDMHDDLVLRSRQRKPDALLAGQQRPSWQRLEDLGQLRAADGAVGILTLRQARSFRYERHGPGALAPDLLEHREVVPGADAQIAGDDFPLAFVRENPGEESPAIIAVEVPPGEGERL